MLQEVGIPVTVRYAEKFGVGSLPSVPSLALGSGEVTLLTMTAAYAAFANEGMLPTPTLIRHVDTADGQTVFQGASPAQRAISEATAFMMTSMLADVINAGTAWTARREGFTLPAAGKTGTTNDYHDAWFVGFTPKLVTGVWVGYDQPKTIVGNGYAAELAVPMWGRFMSAATRNDEPEWFRPPSTVSSATICRLSGKLATDACRTAISFDADGNPTNRSMVYTEYFVRGSEPTDYCPIHGSTLGAFATLATTGSMPAPAPPPPPREAPVVAGGTVPAPPAETASAQSAPEQQKKRGFWSRIFGGDKNNEKKDQK
jgi:penicillin-binding protein 1A